MARPKSVIFQSPGEKRSYIAALKKEAAAAAKATVKAQKELDKLTKVLTAANIKLERAQGSTPAG